MERKPDHPDEPVYRLRWAPGKIDGHNFALKVERGGTKVEDVTFDLSLTDDKYLAWTDLTDDVPTVTVPCHMLAYGSEACAADGSGFHVWMRFRPLPDSDHGLDLPETFWVLGEDYKNYEPTNGFVYNVTPQLGL